MTALDRYLDTLPPDTRGVAREWADMDTAEFQARQGPRLDAIAGSIEELCQKLDQHIDEHRPRNGLRRVLDLRVADLVKGGAALAALLAARGL